MEAVDPVDSFNYYSNEVSNILELKLNNTMNIVLMLAQMISKNLENGKATSF
jgi:hypothetical protein